MLADATTPMAQDTSKLLNMVNTLPWNTTPLVMQLQRRPTERDLNLRPTGPRGTSPFMTHKDPQDSYVIASLGQVKGQEAREPCKQCAGAHNTSNTVTRGRFFTCITVRPWATEPAFADGACMNCYWKHQGTGSFRK